MEDHKKKPDGFFYTSLGLGIYVITLMIHRFLFQIPSFIHIILMIVSIIFIIKGFRVRSKNKSQ